MSGKKEKNQKWCGGGGEGGQSVPKIKNSTIQNVGYFEMRGSEFSYSSQILKYGLYFDETGCPKKNYKVKFCFFTRHSLNTLESFLKQD